MAGYYANLTAGLRRIGLETDFVTCTNHPFQYGGETVEPHALKMMKSFDERRRRYGRLTPLRLLFAMLSEVCRFAWFMTAITRYQAFIFGFGHSLLPWNVDLPILRALGKRIVSNLGHGSEARPPYINGAFRRPDGSAVDLYELAVGTVRRKRLLAWHQRFCSVVVGAPFSTASLSTGSFVNFIALGLPVGFDGPEPNPHPWTRTVCTDPHCVRVVHAPSNPRAKGTQEILKAIDWVRAQGIEIELVLLIGKPHSEVVSELRRCDFVVDQIYSDVPMAGLAAEAAWLGRPTIVGGYGLSRLRRHVPHELWPISRLCEPDEIRLAIRELALDATQRASLGKAAQDFVHANWAAPVVAKRFLRLLSGDIPDDWLVDPCDVVHLEGWGQPAELSRERVRALVSRYGVQALQLSHRPDLEQAFLEFAGLTKPR